MEVEIPQVIQLTGAPMSTSDLVTAVESGALNLNNIDTADSLPYCLVCMNDNHQTSICLQFKDLKDFIRTRNTNFNYWRSQRDGYSSNLSAEEDKCRRRFRPEARLSGQCQRNSGKQLISQDRQT